MKIKLSAWFGLSLLLTVSGANAQIGPADDFFHGGARHYLSNNIPAALQSVTNGLQLYPEDEKLKKLYELLNQQQQQNQKDQQQDQKDEKNQDQKQDQQKKEEKKDQQSKNDQEKKDQQQAKPDEKKESGEPQQIAAHQMTPQEAKQMLDSQKGDEQVLMFKPETDPKRQDKKLKDW